MKPKVYISGALTNFDRKRFYEKIGQIAEGLGYEVYIPHLHTDPDTNQDATPKEVYDTDMNQIDSSQLVIAYVGLPSLGVGAELERASSKKIPIILMYSKDNKVSRLIRGIPMVRKELAYINERYALAQLRYALSSIKEELLKKNPN